MAFEQGLKREGWSLGQNLRIEYRYAEGNAARMQSLAKELVELKPDCIVGHSTPVVTALMHATRIIPIVFVSVSDPIGSGFVASIAHPGGNITGFTILHASIAGKYVSMLKEIVPQLARVALMYNPDSVPDSGTFFSGAFKEAVADHYSITSSARAKNVSGIVRPSALVAAPTDWKNQRGRRGS